MTAATDFSALCKTPALAVMGGSLIGTQAGNSSVVSKGLCSPDLLEAKISNRGPCDPFEQTPPARSYPP